jgi:hypothetical protein
MALAATRGVSALVLAQPLVAGSLVGSLFDGHRERPRRLLLALGGYPCPAGLEAWLVAQAQRAGVALGVLHMYGLAEVEAGLLAGARRADGRVKYRPCLPDYTFHVENGQLRIGRLADGMTIDTFDAARPFDDGFEVLGNPTRYPAKALQALVRWNIDDWVRRTGYAHLRATGPTLWQLREGLAPTGDDEVEHFEFAMRFGMSWLDKPDWSIAGPAGN